MLLSKLRLCVSAQVTITRAAVEWFYDTVERFSLDYSVAFVAGCVHELAASRVDSIDMSIYGGRLFKIACFRIALKFVVGQDYVDDVELRSITLDAPRATLLNHAELEILSCIDWKIAPFLNRSPHELIQWQMPLEVISPEQMEEHRQLDLHIKRHFLSNSMLETAPQALVSKLKAQLGMSMESPKRKRNREFEPQTERCNRKRRAN